jgi:hypothetical protein
MGSAQADVSFPVGSARSTCSEFDICPFLQASTFHQQHVFGRFSPKGLLIAVILALVED